MSCYRGFRRGGFEGQPVMAVRGGVRLWWWPLARQVIRPGALLR